jgi:hypothetical protein
MKKMVPNEDGTVLPTSFQPGDYLILQGSWHLQNIYDIDEIGVVGFVQDNASKEVHQAGNSTTNPLTPLYNNEVSLAGISDISETNCLGSINPKITIRNQGADPLTSVDIYYRVNDETTYTFPWSGNLDFLESAEITLPQTGFDILDENSFYAYTVNPNGLPDEHMTNDTLIQVFDRAAITPLTVKLMIRTDGNPQQTTWEILNSTGEVQYAGGPYSNANTVYNETFQMEDLECYIFKIYDGGGDGLVLPGFYALYYGNGIYIKNGTSFGSIDSAYFEVNTQVGVIEKDIEANIAIYPNPATSSINLYFFMPDNEKVSVTVYDLTGRKVRSEEPGFLAAGPQVIRIGSDDLKPGFYMVQTIMGDKIDTQKITVSK